MEISSRMGAFSAANYGIQRSEQLLNKTANNIATDKGPMEKNMTNLIVAQDSQAANVQTVKTADEMLKELINMR